MKTVDHATPAPFGQVVKAHTAAVSPRHVPNDTQAQAVPALILRAFAPVEPLQLFPEKAPARIADGKAQAAAPSLSAFSPRS